MGGQLKKAALYSFVVASASQTDTPYGEEKFFRGLTAVAEATWQADRQIGRNL